MKRAGKTHPPCAACSAFDACAHGGHLGCRAVLRSRRRNIPPPCAGSQRRFVPSCSATCTAANTARTTRRCSRARRSSRMRSSASAILSTAMQRWRSCSGCISSCDASVRSRRCSFRPAIMRSPTWSLTALSCLTPWPRPGRPCSTTAGCRRRLGGGRAHRRQLRPFSTSIAAPSSTMRWRRPSARRTYPASCCYICRRAFCFDDARERWTGQVFLSGHTHGGVIRIPLIGGLVAPTQGLFPEVRSGEVYGRRPHDAHHHVRSRAMRACRAYVIARRSAWWI